MRRPRVAPRVPKPSCRARRTQMNDRPGSELQIRTWNDRVVVRSGPATLPGSSRNHRSFVSASCNVPQAVLALTQPVLCFLDATHNVCRSGVSAALSCSDTAYRKILTVSYRNRIDPSIRRIEPRGGRYAVSDTAQQIINKYYYVLYIACLIKSIIIESKLKFKII